MDRRVRDTIGITSKHWLQVRGITEGWVNHYLNKINKLPYKKSKLAEDKLKICINCELYTENKCDKNKTTKDDLGETVNGCGCEVDKKVFSETSECPANKWRILFEKG